MSQPSAPVPITIPFNKPYLAGSEFANISEAIRLLHTAGGGPFTRRAEGMIEEITGAPRALLTTSCTDALEMAATLCEVRPGDEVIVPSFTFVSTVNAFVLRGARPVFIDIRRDTLNMDESLLEPLISSRTRAIVPVHYAGVACEMDAICEIASRHGVAIVEDNAHGLFGHYRGRPLGTFGPLTALSFHETKNVTCGEGGALVINDPAYIERAEIVREKGTNRSRFLRGQVDKYTWVDVGSSHLPSDILAAYLVAQLEARDTIQEMRARIWKNYFEQLRDWADACGVQLPFVPEHCSQPFHMFYLVMPSAELRDGLIAWLRQHGILAVFHYVPLHRSPMGERLGCAPDACPVTDEVSARLLRLPFFNALTEDEQQRTIDTVMRFRP